MGRQYHAGKSNRTEHHIYGLDEYQVRPLSHISLIYGMKRTGELREHIDVSYARSVLFVFLNFRIVSINDLVVINTQIYSIE